jgi:hypothetical protein
VTLHIYWKAWGLFLKISLQRWRGPQVLEEAGSILGFFEGRSWLLSSCLELSIQAKQTNQDSRAGGQDCGGCKCINGRAGCRETADKCRMCLFSNAKVSEPERTNQELQNEAS